MKVSLLFVVVLSCVLNSVVADVYMHNPRGSNDRNCERNVNRDNGNRLFNSQNNNKGGYACPRAVGDETTQNEAGDAHFTTVDITTGDTITFTQNKKMYYYSGSVLPIEWTNQHGCGGNSKVTCEIILQYACEDTLDPKVDDFWPWVTNKAEVGTTYRGEQHFRSGSNIGAPRDGIPTDSNDAATDTITDDEADAIASTVTTRRFGMQESYDYYQTCQHTERNKGLYTADQQVNRNDQRGTRQNPNGNRHGFECPEERDYYPWWSPSPWIDIAVLTDSADNEVCYSTSLSCSKRCEYYMNNTMNWNAKGYCDVNRTADGATVATKINSRAWQNRVWYNNKKACQNNGFEWYGIKHSDNLISLEPKSSGTNHFVCAHTQFARVNQLGNARADSIISQSEITTLPVTNDVVSGVNANRFQWTIPNIPTINPKIQPSTNYFSNITSAYQSCVLRMRYNISSADFQQWPIEAVDPTTPQMVDHRNNSRSASDSNTPLTQDPYVYIGPGDDANKGYQFVGLKVNTNQYGRTFQDRSYVFSIKPLPTASQSSSNKLDTPKVDASTIEANLAAGGRIYNVNVRGKRGNIVQVYPAVEYDFVPNQLALSTKDMVHFQWTGSDYNPRRGCNDGEGGPPDANTFFTSANADQNSRADRSNVVFMNHMANNVPRDYLGFEHTTTTLTFAEMQSLSMAQVLSFAPCYSGSTNASAITTTAATDCYQLMMRLAYLNQQSDVGSLILRQGHKCLTESELDALANSDVASNHPLNCAKMNAKPYPYFDGGLMTFKRSGYFPYYSSRNNNFSNRQNIGVVCVGSSCKVDNSTGVLQDVNPEVTGTGSVAGRYPVLRTSASSCYSTVNGQSGATTNGAVSCLTTNSAGQVVNGTTLAAETFFTQNQDNDSYGDGEKKGCAILALGIPQLNTIEQKLALAFSLLGVGLFAAWLSYYLYNRYQARLLAEGKFRHDTAWKAEMVKYNKAVIKNPNGIAAPADAAFTMTNPGVKFSRDIKPAGANIEKPKSAKAKGAANFSPVAGVEIDGSRPSGKFKKSSGFTSKHFKPNTAGMI